MQPQQAGQNAYHARGPTKAKIGRPEAHLFRRLFILPAGGPDIDPAVVGATDEERAVG